MSHWYLVHTKVRQEQVALTQLERQGYHCFLPLHPVEKLRRHKLQVVQEPLFPRYLFIQLDTDTQSQSWSPIRSTLGVSRLVMFGQTPGRVGDELIEQLRGQHTAQAPAQALFQPGDAVTITQGPFAGIEAVYHMANGEERVMVLLDILSKQVKMSVSPADLRKRT
jgi:transcriptional antiterminator RfaH